MSSFTTFIIIGFSGDLARKKLIPALYALFVTGKLSSFIIVGSGIEQIDVQQILDLAKPFAQEFKADLWDQFCAHIFYMQSNISVQEDAVRFKQYVDTLERNHTVIGNNRLLYLAVGAYLFASITHQAIVSGLICKTDLGQTFWHRIVYEKPFGHDKTSAHEINTEISCLLDENQVYRIDHYLTKELVSTISLVRFTNAIFEPLWNNRFIDQVHIVLNETIDVEGRGGYYDKYGALRDVVQNHMMQMLALIAMEAPEQLSGEAIRDKRVALLKDVVFVDGIRGQYNGYRDEQGVRSDSDTETFAALCFYIDNPRWQNVPFFFTTGKCLKDREVAIHIKFKQVDCLLAKDCSTMSSNWLTFMIAPEELFSLQLNVKKPGETDTLIPMMMNFCHSCVFSTRATHAYEVLFQEVMRGEQASSVRFDEIEVAWDIIDQIEKKALPLFEYSKETTGPKELEQFMQTYNVRKRA